MSGCPDCRKLLVDLRPVAVAGCNAQRARVLTALAKAALEGDATKLLAELRALCAAHPIRGPIAWAVVLPTGCDNA